MDLCYTSKSVFSLSLSLSIYVRDLRHQSSRIQTLLHPVSTTYKNQGQCASAIYKGIRDSAVGIGIAKSPLPTEKAPDDERLRYFQIDRKI